MTTHQLAAPILLTLISLALSLGIAEGVLRAVTPFPITELSNRRSDPDFGYVVSSDIPDVDEHGFRNRGATLQDADLVVVGDSHTYGYNVDVVHAFPFVLGRLTHRRVYAMGVGGYGIYQYLALFHALERNPPKQVLLALYPANDLGSACSIVTLPTWRTLAREAGIAPPPCNAPETKDGSLFEESALIGAMHYAWLRLAPASCPDPAISFREGPCQTIERGERHSRLTSLESADNRQRLADAFKILAYAHERFARAGVPFSVLIIPSRERVLLEWARKYTDESDPRLDALVLPEIELTERFEDYLRSLAVPTRDASPDVVDAFAAAVKDHVQFYPATSDGHPFAPGYAAYASAALPLIDAATTMSAAPVNDAVVP